MIPDPIKFHMGGLCNNISDGLYDIHDGVGLGLMNSEIDKSAVLKGLCATCL